MAKVEGVPGLEKIDSSGIYTYRRTFQGKCIKKSLGTRKKAIAIKMAMEINQQIEEKKATPEAAVGKNTTTFEKMASDYINSRQLAPKSINRYTTVTRNIKKSLEEVLSKSEPKISDITREVIEEYVSYRKSCEVSPNGHEHAIKQVGISPKTLKGELDLMKSILKYAVKKELLIKIPDFDGMKPRVPRKGEASEVARPLESFEVEEILNAAKEYDNHHQGEYVYPNYFESLLKLYFCAGLRFEEGKFLEWSDINFNQETIKLRPKKVVCKRKIKFTSKVWDKIKGSICLDRNQQAIRNHKTILRKVGYALNFKSEPKLLALQGQDFDIKNYCVNYIEKFDWKPKASVGDVPIHSELLETLNKLNAIKTSNFIFPDVDGGYFVFKLDRVFKQLVKNAGIDDNVRLHDMRHTLGYLLRRQGVGLEVIKEILRHASIEQTLVYAKYNQEEGKAALEKIKFNF